MMRSLLESLPRSWLPRLLFALGGVCLLAALSWAGYIALNSWFMDQDWHLVSNQIAELSSQGRTASAAASLSALPASVSDPAAPVQIRIKSIGVDRSVIELPWVVDPDTGGTKQDVEILLDSGRKDLVGHWGGSAYPGQSGNTILVGHNYGHKSKGVFVKLERLEAGQEIQVVNAAGQTFTYRVQTVQQVPWQKKDTGEVLAHWEFLSHDGPERLTLVTCGGAKSLPFPKRVYVVAEPIPPTP